MTPSLFVGIDLTDAYARTPRKVDVATLDAETLKVVFSQFEWPPEGAGSSVEVARLVRSLGRDKTVFIVDGPQALARVGNDTRVVEWHLCTPGHTPGQVPDPRTRPFAGYIRTSINFFNALVGAGFNLAELANAENSADLFEAYPGAVWPLWHRSAEPLQSKSTVVGRNQRRAILEAVGCNFGKARELTHDQLDAGVCAALGWRFFLPNVDWPVELVPPPAPTVEQNLAVFRDASGLLREGRMLMPRVSGPFKGRAGKRLEPQTRLDQADLQAAAETKFPRCDWVYFAGPARANQTETFDLAVEEEIIVRTVYNAKRQPIANVQHLKPGATLLLAFGHGNSFKALCSCRISKPDRPLPHRKQPFRGCGLADPALDHRLHAAGYSPDPKVNKFTIIPVTEIHDLQNVPVHVPRPRGNNTVWRWEDVFPSGNRTMGT